jgi:hypothetical protein
MDRREPNLIDQTEMDLFQKWGLPPLCRGEVDGDWLIHLRNGYGGRAVDGEAFIEPRAFMGT